MDPEIPAEDLARLAPYQRRLVEQLGRLLRVCHGDPARDPALPDRICRMAER